MRIVFLTLMLILSTTSVAGSRIQFGEANPSTQSVSLVALIAMPEKYSGKAVRVEGAFRLEFEGNALCLTKDDLNHYISKNCLWLALGEKTLEPKYRELTTLNGQFVLVEGIFNGNDHGHMGMSSGAITNIWRVMSAEVAR